MTILLAIFLTAQSPAATTQTPPPATQTKPSAPAQTRPPGTTQPATTTAAPLRRTTMTPANATVQVRVTDRIGTPAAGAHVVAEGPSQREGSTDALGTVTFRTLMPGTYRVRAERDGLIALEKEITIRNALPLTTEFALSAAAPPPPAPVAAPAPAPAPPRPVVAPVAPAPSPVVGAPGEAKVLSILDLAGRSLSGREPVKFVPIGCSGASNAELIVVREGIPAGASTAADLMLYLVAGEAALTLNGKEQNLSPSWFGIVPHGTTYAVTRKGRNPAIFLAIVAGQPCTSAVGQR